MRTSTSTPGTRTRARLVLKARPNHPVSLRTRCGHIRRRRRALPKSTFHGRSVPSARRTAISSSRAASTRASCSGVQLMIPERTYRARHRRLTLTSGDQTLLGTGIRQGGGITTAAAAMIRRTGTAPVDASNPHCQVSEMARAVKTGTFWNSWVLFAHRQTQPAKPGHPGQKSRADWASRLRGTPREQTANGR
jgi:hypothetical protein